MAIHLSYATDENIDVCVRQKWHNVELITSECSYDRICADMLRAINKGLSICSVRHVTCSSTLMLSELLFDSEKTSLFFELCRAITDTMQGGTLTLCCDLSTETACNGALYQTLLLLFKEAHRIAPNVSFALEGSTKNPWCIHLSQLSKNHFLDNAYYASFVLDNNDTLDKLLPYVKEDGQLDIVRMKSRSKSAKALQKQLAATGNIHTFIYSSKGVQNEII